MNRLFRWMHGCSPPPPRIDLRAAAEEIAEKERRLAVLKMKREAAQRELQEAFADLLKIKGPGHGDD